MAPKKQRTNLPCSSSHQKFAAVFAQANLLNSKSGVVTVWVKTAHLRINEKQTKVVQYPQY